MELFFLSLLFISSYAQFQDCGWAVNYAEWSPAKCEEMKVSFHRFSISDDQDLVNSFQSQVSYKTDAVYTPGFWIGQGDTFHGIDGNIFSNDINGRETSLESTLPENSRKWKDLSQMAAISGVTHNSIPPNYCNGVRFTTNFGLKLGLNHGSWNQNIPASVTSEYKIALDASLGTSNPNIGVILTYNGGVVSRTRSGRRIHSAWANGLEVAHNWFSEIRVDAARSSQQMSIYLFKLGPDAPGTEPQLDFFVSPFWVRARPNENGVNEAVFNPNQAYANYAGFQPGKTYSIGFRYGNDGSFNIGELISNHTGGNRKGGIIGTNFLNGKGIIPWDTFNTNDDKKELWCKDSIMSPGSFFEPSTVGFIRVEAKDDLISGKQHIKVLPVGELSSGKLQWAGRCYAWEGGDKVWKTLGGDQWRAIPVDHAGWLVMDPCGHPDFLGFFTSPHSDSLAKVKCVSSDLSCGSVAPRVGNIGYCHGTMSVWDAVLLCGSVDSLLPTHDQLSMCCEDNDRCSVGRDLIWVFEIGTNANLDFIESSADYWTRVTDNDDYILTMVSNGVEKKFATFLDNDGVEFNEEFIVPNTEVEIEINMNDPDNICDELFVVFLYEAIDGYISGFHSLQLTRSFGLYVTLYDLNNVDLSADFGDLPVVAHGFAPFQAINFYSPAGFSSPGFGVGVAAGNTLPAMHGSYGATFVTSIYHIVEECCSVHVMCSSGSECDILRNDQTSDQICFDSSNRKLRIEVVYRKRQRSAATDFALYWLCPSHLRVTSGDDSLSVPAESGVLAFWEALPILDNNFDIDATRGRIIPAGCLDSRQEGAGLDIKRYETPVKISTFGSQVFRVSLLTRPEHTVRVSFSGPYSFSECEMLFTINSWATSQIVFASVSADSDWTNPGPITMTCSSEDPKYDGYTLDEVITLDVDGSLGSCQMDFFKRALNSWSSPENGEMYSSNYVGDFVVFGPKNEHLVAGVLLHVHARAEPCGLHSCVTSVGIQYGRNIFAVYKAPIEDSFSFNVLSGSSSSVSVYEVFGCWKVVLPDNNVIHICPNTDSYLDINIDFNFMYYDQITSSDVFEGACWGQLVIPQSSVLKYPVEAVASVGHERSLQMCENGLPMTNGITISAEVRPMPRTTQIVRNPHGLRGDPGAPNAENPLGCGWEWAQSVLKRVVPAAFGTGNLGVQQLTTFCQGYKDLLFNGAADAILVSAKTMYYFHSAAFYRSHGSPNSVFFQKSIIENNPRFCPFGKVTSTACDCPGDVCFAPAPQPQDSPTPCTSKHSVLLDENSGKIIKCSMGMCEYSSNGFAWEGLPTDPSNTPYCLSAISNGPVLWGFTVAGEEIKSSDFGQSWTPGSYDVTEKVSFTYAHSDSFGNISPYARQSSRSVPAENWFSGIGSDRWWLTPDDLCVYSNRLAVTKSLIYCVRWWCDCLDYDTWSSSFGVDTLA